MTKTGKPTGKPNGRPRKDGMVRDKNGKLVPKEQLQTPKPAKEVKPVAVETPTTKEEKLDFTAPKAQEPEEPETYKCARCRAVLQRGAITCVNCGVTLDWGAI